MLLTLQRHCTNIAIEDVAEISILLKLKVDASYSVLYIVTYFVKQSKQGL
jgi:hypothetical protein